MSIQLGLFTGNRDESIKHEEISTHIEEAEHRHGNSINQR